MIYKLGKETVEGVESRDRKTRGIQTDTQRHPEQKSHGLGFELPGGQSKEESRAVARVRLQEGRSAPGLWAKHSFFWD